MKAETSWRLAMLSTVPFIMVLGNSMLIPVLPAMQEVMHLSKSQAGLLITLFSIPAGLTIPWAGMLSDRVGRKTVMVPALVVYGIGGLIAGVAALLLRSSAFWPIMVGRVIQGVGAGGTYQLAMALTGDIFNTRERTKALGLLEAANGLGKVISPIAGAAVALIVWFAPFFVYGLLALPIAAAVWMVVKEPQTERAEQGVRQYFGSLGGVLAKKGLPLSACFLAGMVALFVLFGVLAHYSDVLEDRYRVEGFRKGLVLAGPVLAMAIASYVTGTVLQKRLAKLLKVLVLVGLGLVAAGVAGVGLTRQALLLFGAIGLIGLGNGLILPAVNTMITSAAGSEERGAVTAFYGTVRFFGVAVGPPTFGLVDRLGPGILMLGAAGLTAAAGLFAWGFVDQKKLMPAHLLRGGQGGTGKGRATGGGE